MLKKWVPLWVVPVLLGFAVGTVWLRLLVVRTSYSISEADRSITRLRQDLEILQLKVSALRSPVRLGKLAERQFNLFHPTMDQVVHIQKVEIEEHGP